MSRLINNDIYQQRLPNLLLNESVHLPWKIIISNWALSMHTLNNMDKHETAYNFLNNLIPTTLRNHGKFFNNIIITKHHKIKIKQCIHG